MNIVCFIAHKGLLLSASFSQLNSRTHQLHKLFHGVSGDRVGTSFNNTAAPIHQLLHQRASAAGRLDDGHWHMREQTEFITGRQSAKQVLLSVQTYKQISTGQVTTFKLVKRSGVKWLHFEVSTAKQLSRSLCFNFMHYVQKKINLFSARLSGISVNSNKDCRRYNFHAFCYFQKFPDLSNFRKICNITRGCTMGGKQVTATLLIKLKALQL